MNSHVHPAFAGVLNAFSGQAPESKPESVFEDLNGMMGDFGKPSDHVTETENETLLSALDRVNSLAFEQYEKETDPERRELLKAIYEDADGLWHQLFGEYNGADGFEPTEDVA